MTALLIGGEAPEAAVLAAALEAHPEVRLTRGRDLLTVAARLDAATAERVQDPGRPWTSPRYEDRGPLRRFLQLALRLDPNGRRSPARVVGDLHPSYAAEAARAHELIPAAIILGVTAGPVGPGALAIAPAALREEPDRIAALLCQRLALDPIEGVVGALRVGLDACPPAPGSPSTADPLEAAWIAFARGETAEGLARLQAAVEAELSGGPPAPVPAWVHLIDRSPPTAVRSWAAAACAHPEPLVREALARWLRGRGLDEEAAEIMARVEHRTWWFPPPLPGPRG